VTDLHLEDVGVRFGNTPALQDLTLDVEDGEFFTLVGPSGCGKTTTLRAVAGFQVPDTGTVRFGETDVSGVPPEDRGVGVVFQNYALFPHLTVGENVAYGLQFHHPPGDVTPDERVQDLLDLVDLSGMADRDPASLSGGQQQRVSLARALAPGPEILLLDEPMSALDARLRQRLRVQVKGIQAELGITTLYVTHDQGEALAISDRVAVMHDGRVEQVGTPEDIYRQPASTFVASFVGDNNVLTGDASPLETGGSSVVVREGQIRTDSPASGPCTVAIRPEHLSFDSGTAGGDEPRGELAVTVERTEFLGDAYRVHCDWHGARLLVKTETDPPSGAATVSYRPADVQVLDD
jgi:thiamine transport system ATP-binding protein